jgi:hypothetical protein
MNHVIDHETCVVLHSIKIRDSMYNSFDKIFKFFVFSSLFQFELHHLY